MGANIHINQDITMTNQSYQDIISEGARNLSVHIVLKEYQSGLPSTNSHYNLWVNTTLDLKSGSCRSEVLGSKTRVQISQL